MVVFVKLSVVSVASQSYCQLEASSTTQAALALVNFCHQKLFTHLCSVYYHSWVAFVSLRASDFAATIQEWDMALSRIIYHFCHYVAVLTAGLMEDVPKKLI